VKQGETGRAPFEDAQKPYVNDARQSSRGFKIGERLAPKAVTAVSELDTKENYVAKDWPEMKRFLDLLHGVQ